jgi:hypothetical protein
VSYYIQFLLQYFGINPFVVKHSVTKASEYMNAATTVGSALLGSLAGLGAQKATQTQQPISQAPQSKWGSAMYAIGGAVMAGAVAGGAYYRRDDLTQGLSWASDHLKYVGNLWDEESLKQRVEALIDIEKERGIIFRTLVNIYQLSLMSAQPFLLLLTGYMPLFHPNRPSSLPRVHS